MILVLSVFSIACDPPSQDSVNPPADAIERSPNLIIITLDTTRADALGSYGQIMPTSPVIDRMAKEGVLFERAVASSPETLPSHASIFTGLQPYAHGVRSNHGYQLSEENLTLAEVLNAHGYQTSAEIAAIVMRKSTQIAQGFSEVRDPNSEGAQRPGTMREFDGVMEPQLEPSRIGEDVMARGLEYIRAHKEEKFFLWLHFFDAHFPYSSPSEYTDRIPSSPYHAGVNRVDSLVGEIIEELKKLGLRENTLVILTADHGEGLQDHGERTHSYFLYDSTVHVPLIFWGLEALPAGRRIPSLVRLVDIVPTALDLLGVAPLDDIHGVSLEPLLTDEVYDLALTGYGEATRIASTFGLSPLRFLQHGRWKYIHKVSPELYDVVSDPGETQNLAESQPEKLEELRARLEKLVEEGSAGRNDAVVPVTTQVRSQLRALGYVDGAEGKELVREHESLVLHGVDPRSKVQDIELMGLAAAKVTHRDFEAALQYVVPLWMRNPNQVMPVGLMAEVLVALERWEEAIPVLRHYLALDPQMFNMQVLLYRSLEATGDLDGALAILSEMQSVEPCNESTMAAFMGIYQESGQFAEMLARIAHTSQACPDLLANVNNYAWALATLPVAELRDGKKAVGLIRRAIIKMGSRDPSYLDTLAAALAETGNFDEAIRVQIEALEILKSSNSSETIVTMFAAHLDHFRAGLPLRDPAME